MLFCEEDDSIIAEMSINRSMQDNICEIVPLVTVKAYETVM